MKPNQPNKQPVYKAVSASLRVLEVLEALNAIGPAGLTALCRRCDLPKSTTLRMLETLQAGGFATYESEHRKFAVGLRALALSNGYDAIDAIVNIARPVVVDLRADLGWPSDIVVFQNDQLIIADTNTTEPQFPVARGRGAGSSLPYTISATGRTWLAFCSEEVRERLLRFENPHPLESRDLMERSDKLRAILDETRRRGYGLQSGEFLDREAGIGVPVIVKGELRCCLNVVMARNAVSLEQIQRQYVPQLLAAAGEIARRAQHRQ